LNEKRGLSPDLFFFSRRKSARENKMVEQKNPDKINPAEDRNDDTEDKSKDVATGGLLKHGSDTDINLDDPANDWDQEKNELH
jgi:hypothetical protein